jgi:hypothetical protein
VFDWNKSSNFISNRNQYKWYQTNSEDSIERSCKIKNLIEELPTYEVLFKRQVEGIISNICPRCERCVENWDHTWTCVRNEFTIRETIESAVWKFEEYLDRQGDKEKVAILRDININFFMHSL